MSFQRVVDDTKDTNVASETDKSFLFGNVCLLGMYGVLIERCYMNAS